MLYIEYILKVYVIYSRLYIAQNLQTGGWSKATLSIQKPIKCLVWSKITLFWILNVFWKYHICTEGNVNTMLFLDNCYAHTLSDKETSKLPKQVFSKFLSPNVTNTHQPAVMVMIVSIKVGYRVTLLEQLLSFFDIKGG